MIETTLQIAAALAAQVAPQAQAPVPEGAPPDFRAYVFAAYGAVLVLLLLFSLWSVAQVRAAERKADRLERRLGLQEKAKSV
jgi:hypothetical protein